MARFTDRQLDDAKCTDLVSFLRFRGERLVHSGGEYRWVYRDRAGEHDSVTVKGNRWFDHKRQIGGDAIGFLQEFHGLNFREAVASLIGQHDNLPAPCRQAEHTEEKQKPFTLPPRAENMHRLYAYLCRTRCIDHEVVSHFVRQGTLYEDAEYHNAVFIATDEQNKPLGGMKKSTLSGSSFRQTISGSDTRYAFHHSGTSRRVYVFEAAVDMLSFITLYPDNWKDHNYIALDGVSSKALHHFLDAHNDIRDIYLCLDNDEAGHTATQRIIGELCDRGYSEMGTLMPEEKDWNEKLQNDMVHSRDTPEMDMTL